MAIKNKCDDVMILWDDQEYQRCFILSLFSGGEDGQIKSRIKGKRRRKNLIYKVWSEALCVWLCEISVFVPG